MISENTTSLLDVMLCTLYGLVEAAYFLHYRSSDKDSSISLSEGRDQSDPAEEWKRELPSRGKTGKAAVTDWVDGWFASSHQGGNGTHSKDIKQGNVEMYLSERVFGLSVKEVLDDPSKHHALIALISELVLKRNRRFSGGYNTDLRSSLAKEQGRRPYRPLIFRFMAILCCVFQEMFNRSQTAEVARSFGTSKESKSFNDVRAPAQELISAPNPHSNTSNQAIPPSSTSMTSSLSNLSSIGLCVAPPLRTRLRSRTIEAVISVAQIPVSSLAMMSSMSNLSSIGMCVAPPLRIRQRSRSSVIGYASAVPFVSRKYSAVS